VSLVGAVAAWRLGAVAQAHEWVVTLRRRPAFCSLEVLRATLLPTYDPASLGQLEQLLGTMREAGLPAQ
jgi:hypothetical protein